MLAGAISDSYGNGSLHARPAAGTLYIAGSDTTPTSGPTTIVGTVILAKTGGAIAIPYNLTLSEIGDGSNTILQLNGDNQIDPSAVLTFSTSVASARLELNGHVQTVAGISGNSQAVIEGLYDNTGLNSDSTLTVNNSDGLHLCRRDPRQRPGQRHGQAESGQERLGQPAAKRHGQLQRLDHRQRRHAASDRLELLLLRRQHRLRPAPCTSTAPPVIWATPIRSPARARCRSTKGRTACTWARATTPR